MTASPEMLAAFEAWKLAELASHYAAPCPDEVMNDLVERERELFAAVMATPVDCADGLLLKLYPVLLREWKPGRAAPPLLPSASRAYDYNPSVYQAIIEGLSSLSEPIARAMQSPPSPYYEEKDRG